MKNHLKPSPFTYPVLLRAIQKPIISCWLYRKYLQTNVRYNLQRSSKGSSSSHSTTPSFVVENEHISSFSFWAIWWFPTFLMIITFWNDICREPLYIMEHAFHTKASDHPPWAWTHISSFQNPETFIIFSSNAETFFVIGISFLITFWFFGTPLKTAPIGKSVHFLGA